MIPVVIAVEHSKDHELRLEFADGVQGRVDVARLVSFTGVFEPLEDVEEFRQVRVDPESGPIAWPNGADLDPLVLYATVTAVDVDELLDARSPSKG